MENLSAKPKFAAVLTLRTNDTENNTGNDTENEEKQSDG